MASAESPDNIVLTYPDTGNTAVVACKSRNGRIITIYNDTASSKSKVLVMFNAQGVGGVSYANGKPWLVVTADGWSVSDAKGNLLERGKFPRDGPEIRCEPTPDTTVSFVNRQKITVGFTREGHMYQWDCGEVMRCPAAGQLAASTRKQLSDTSTRRAVTPDTGLYPQPTQLNQLGSLRAVLKTLKPTADVQGTIQGLEAVDARVKLINTLPVPSYGTSRTSTPLSLQGTARDQGMPLEDQGISTGTLSSSPSLPDYGKPPMSSKQRRWQKAGISQRSPPQYQLARARLESIRMDAVEDAVMGKGAAPDTLYCLCILADFQPGCARVRPQLEGGWHILQGQAAADPGSPAHHIRVLHVDASEDRKLQKRFNYRSVPIFLMFYGTRLVYANNNISTKDELVAACHSALERGRRGESLPDDFSFGLCDNSLLDHITPSLSLRGQC